MFETYGYDFKRLNNSVDVAVPLISRHIGTCDLYFVF